MSTSVNIDFIKCDLVNVSVQLSQPHCRFDDGIWVLRLQMESGGIVLVISLLDVLLSL